MRGRVPFHRYRQPAACSVNGDQIVAGAKIQQRVSGILQFQRRVDTSVFCS
jgi:hypothetical protein